ncbi:MAG: SpoIIE family protein phosphatase [Sulfurimonadaceae bacterium]|jgi:hypothetical protein|nr:SpoIIE family protein phosphatase [Sulfurimonadaceae bacterium]
MSQQKQQELAFKKEINLLRNDYYYQYCGEIFSPHSSMIDGYYRPLEILSGDTYSIRKLSPSHTFYLLVNALGTGVAASVTAITLTSFINYAIDKILASKSDFDMRLFIEEILFFIKPILLEDETLSAHFITCDTQNNTITYASFNMPSLFLCDYENNLLKLPSNNGSINKKSASFKVDVMHIPEIKKVLIYSDGLVENKIKNSDNCYGKYIDEDFIQSFSRDDMETKVENRLDEQTDDITFIFLNKMDFEKKLVAFLKIESSLQAVEEAQIWQENVIGNIINNQDFIEKCNYPFRELLLNAFEHGNLGISNSDKHNAIANGDYWDMIEQLEKDCDKSIDIAIYTVHHLKNDYIITTITDEGEGFDTSVLRDILFKKENFNGRGVFISKRFSNGIYYNSIGNSILIINKIDS